MAGYGGRSPLKIAKARFAHRPRAAIAFFDHRSFCEGDSGEASLSVGEFRIF